MSTFDNKMLDGSNMMMDAVNAIRAKSDARRDIEAKVLAENRLGSKNQLFASSLVKFNHIVDTLIENKDSDISLKIFDAQEGIENVAKDARFTPRPRQLDAWTKQDNNPEKNSTFTGAAKDNPNKGGYAGGSKAVTKGNVTVVKRIKEDLQELSKGTLGSYIKKAHNSGANAEAAQQKALSTNRRKGASSTAFAKAQDTGVKREMGIKRAVNKLTKEESDLQELSPELLDRARSKASGRADVASHALGINHPITKAHKNQLSNIDTGHYRASAKAATKSFVATNKMSGAMTRRAANIREEEIIETILAMEGLHSIDQLTESGLEKLDAIVEQVMMDESSDVQEVLDPATAALVGYAGAAAGIGLGHAALKAHKWIKGKINDHRIKKSNEAFRKKNPHYYEPGGVFHGRKD